ncbi:hypothetical protein LTR86_007246 [Recurvomyces mirabilis]|nr:hypothetical protein LTR86_007246 [Recurvomyces mirabilis]
MADVAMREANDDGGPDREGDCHCDVEANMCLALSQTPGNMLERLPPEMQLEIIRHLDYQAAIRLSQVNRCFQLMVKPSTWPEQDKHYFITIAQKWAKHNIATLHHGQRKHGITVITNGFACYSCCRVLPRFEFSISQSSRRHQKSSPRRTRFCITCGIACNIYQPGLTLRRVSAESYSLGRAPTAPSVAYAPALYCGNCRGCHRYSEVVPPIRCPAGLCRMAYADGVPESFVRENQGSNAWDTPAEYNCSGCNELVEIPVHGRQCFDCGRDLCYTCFKHCDEYAIEIFCSGSCKRRYREYPAGREERIRYLRKLGYETRGKLQRRVNVPHVNELPSFPLEELEGAMKSLFCE